MRRKEVGGPGIDVGLVRLTRLVAEVVRRGFFVGREVGPTEEARDSASLVLPALVLFVSGCAPPTRVEVDDVLRACPREGYRERGWAAGVGETMETRPRIGFGGALPAKADCRGRGLIEVVAVCVVNPSSVSATELLKLPRRGMGFLKPIVLGVVAVDLPDAGVAPAVPRTPNLRFICKHTYGQ